MDADHWGREPGAGPNCVFATTFRLGQMPLSPEDLGQITFARQCFPVSFSKH